MSVELLYFKAEWCGPCKQQGPIVEELADEYNIGARGIDVDENMELANEYTIRSVPTLVLEEDGTPVERFGGFTSKNDVATVIESIK